MAKYAVALVVALVLNASANLMIKFGIMAENSRPQFNFDATDPPVSVSPDPPLVGIKVARCRFGYTPMVIINKYFGEFWDKWRTCQQMWGKL